MGAHTPTPWKLLNGSTRHADRPYQIVRDYDGPYHPVTRWGSTFCAPSLPEGKANAALIVEAVNSHAANLERIAVLEAALQGVSDHHDWAHLNLGIGTATPKGMAWMAVRAALRAGLTVEKEPS